MRREPEMISIHQRVFLSAMLTLCLFLGLSVWFLEGFFKSYVEKNMQDNLQNYIYSLLASANEDELGRMRLPDILPNPALTSRIQALEPMFMVKKTVITGLLRQQSMPI